MYTKREAASALGIDRNTLDKWLQVCGITPKRDPRDTRLRLLSEDDLLKLREHYAESHRAFNGASVRLDTSSADLAARVTELERIVAEQQARLDAILAPPLQLPAYVPPKRQIVTTVSHTQHTKHPPLPAGIVGLEPYASKHEMSRSTAKNAVKAGRLIVERDTEYQEGANVIRNVLDTEGQAQWHQEWAHKRGWGDPCRFCGWSSKRELPATLAVVAGSHDLDDDDQADGSIH